jgi:antitoxin ParD1/3/4
MPTRNFVLTAHQQELLASLVESGRHQNARGHARGAAPYRGGRDQEAAKLKSLREAAQVGWDAYTAGESIEVSTEDDVKSFWAGVDAEVSARTTKAR